MWDSIIAWIEHHRWLVGGIGAFLLLIATPWAGMGAKMLEERRAKRVDQRKAANDLLHVADDFRRYWAQRHFDHVNQQPRPDEEPGWAGGPFNPLIATPQLQSIYSRLSPGLQSAVFHLDQGIKNVASEVAGMAEWVPEKLEDDGPIRDAGITIEAEELFLMIAKEAGILDSSPSTDIASVRDWLEKAHRLRATQVQAHKKFTKKLFEGRSTTS
jgi:hypothetical protein